MELTLPENSITWQARKSQSTIDLVFTSTIVRNLIQSCQTRQDLQHGSDHIPIVTEIEVDMQDIVPRKRRAWKTAKANEVIKEAKKLGEALG